MSEPKTADNPAGRKWRWQEGDYEVIRSAARSGPGCHGNCGVLMYVKDDKLEKIEGDSENPYNQGRLCLRCLAFKEMLYHPDRLLYPMKRKREERGQNAFERVSWEKATEIILEEMGKVIERARIRFLDRALETAEYDLTRGEEALAFAFTLPDVCCDLRFWCLCGRLRRGSKPC